MTSLERLGRCRGAWPLPAAQPPPAAPAAVPPPHRLPSVRCFAAAATAHDSCLPTSSMTDVSDIPALVRDLRSPRPMEQALAAEALAWLAEEAPAEVLAAGAYPALALVLASTSNRTVRGTAVQALLAGYSDAYASRQLDAFHQDIAAAVAGSIPSLLALLDSSLPEAQQAAADALVSFAAHSTDAAAAIMAAGGVPAMVRCLRESPVLKASAAVADALSTLCGDDSRIQRAFVVAGAAPALMPLLASSQAQAQCFGAWGLQALVRNCPEGQQAAEAAGAVPALAQLLAKNEYGQLSRAAVHALFELSQSTPATGLQLVGCAPAVVRILQHGNGDDQRAAVGLLSAVSNQSGFWDWQAIAAAGAQPALEAYISAHSQDAGAAAAVKVAASMLRALSSSPAT